MVGEDEIKAQKILLQPLGEEPGFASKLFFFPDFFNMLWGIQWFLCPNAISKGWDPILLSSRPVAQVLLVGLIRQEGNRRPARAIAGPWAALASVSIRSGPEECDCNLVTRRHISP